MILSDATIAEYIKEKKIVILPEFDQSNIRPAGIRLHLGEEILVLRPNQTVVVDGTDTVQYDHIKISPQGYALPPGGFILGSTYESFQLPRNVIGYFDGRSTVARLGLAIHCTSATVDGNFEEPRSVVLEIKNQSPMTLVLRPKMAIAMLVLHELTTPIQQNAQAQYKGQTSVVPPNLKVQKQ
ncbi:MAG: dCTP deaminase [bacterium]|nr:dCTP deaminase [bacterium]